MRAPGRSAVGPGLGRRAAYFADPDGNVVAVARRLLAEAPREPPVLEDSSAGLASGAVVDRVLLEVDLRDRGAAAVAGLAELLMDAVGLLVVRALLT